jgi:hypothetical protein
MGYMRCVLCGTGRVLVDYGPICRGCTDAADPNTIEGAVLLVYMMAQRSDDCTGEATATINLLEPFVMRQKRTLTDPKHTSEEK